MASRSFERAQTFATEHGLTRAYGSYSEIMADDGVDVIYIATPHPQHHAIALAAIAAGKAALVEKTFTATVAGAEEIIAAARQHQVFVMEAMWTRFQPAIVAARALIDEGAIGEVRQLQADLGVDRPYNPADRLFDPAQGGGAMLDLGVYVVSFAQYFLGTPDRVEVSGSLAPTGVDAEAGLLLGYDDGRVATLLISLKHHTPGAARIQGTKGWIEVPPRFHHPHRILLHRRGQEPETISRPPLGAGYSHELIEVTEQVRAGQTESVIILAISLAMAITPTVYPTIFAEFPEGVRTIINSGITMGSITAILLNLIFNVWGGKSNLVTKVLPTPQHDDVLSIDQVNQMDREQFVAEFGGLFQGPPWIAEQAYQARPFEDVYALRRAFHDVLFEAPADKQLELIQSYPDIGSVFRPDASASVLSVKDQAFAGLDRLDSDEFHNITDLTTAYRKKFGFPLIIAIRENTKETILRAGNARLQNSPAAEQATALVEIAKIANLRLLDIVEEEPAAEQLAG